MQFTAFTDYALRVLIHLAVQDDALCTIKEVAAGQGGSVNHLTKVVHQLGRHGYVQTVRGHGGGIRLGMPPERIIVGEVVRRVEENMALVACFAAGDRRCRIEPACVLKGAFGRALEAFLRELDSVTLADVTKPRAALHAAIGG